MTSLIIMIVSHFTKRFEYWPPPSPTSWQYKAFWWLGRVAMICLTSLIIIQTKNMRAIGFGGFQIIGAILFVAGMLLTLAAGLTLGVKQTKGHDLGLRTTGLYSLTRNPQYVGAFIWIIGLAIFIDNFSVRVILAIIFGIYALCPFMEEPWLEKNYGEDYLKYKKSVPRFLLF